MSKGETRLYIAYGSNMNLEQMENRCPTAKVVGTTFLRNWQLLFWSVATIERFKGGKVPVVVWDIKPQDEAALDVYEGFPRLYRKESVRVTVNGKQVRAMVYIMNHGQLRPPSEVYYNTILAGYHSAGFDANILYDAAQRANNIGGVSISPTVKEQILAVRDTGETNMFDINAVMNIAMREGYYELVDYVFNHSREYSRFIMTGSADDV